MSINEIHSKILWNLIYHFNLDFKDNLSSASFKNDLKLNTWEINMFLYYIEQQLDIKLSKGIETEIDSINQLIGRISHRNHFDKQPKPALKRAS